MVRALFRNTNNTRSHKNLQSNMLLAASNLTRPEYTLDQRTSCSSSEFSINSPTKNTSFSRTSFHGSSESLPSAPLFLKKQVRFSTEAPKATKMAANSKHMVACWYTASEIGIMAQQAEALCEQVATSNDDKNKVNRYYVMSIQDVYQTCLSVDDENLLQDADDEHDGSGPPALSVLTDIEEQELQQGISQSDLFGLEATACSAYLEVGQKKTRKAMKRAVREVQRALPMASCRELRRTTISLRLRSLSLSHRLFAWEMAKALHQVLLLNPQENQA